MKRQWKGALTANLQQIASGAKPLLLSAGKGT